MILWEVIAFKHRIHLKNAQWGAGGFIMISLTFRNQWSRPVCGCWKKINNNRWSTWQGRKTAQFNHALPLTVSVFTSWVAVTSLNICVCVCVCCMPTCKCVLSKACFNGNASSKFYINPKKKAQKYLVNKHKIRLIGVVKNKNTVHSHIHPHLNTDKLCYLSSCSFLRISICTERPHNGCTSGHIYVFICVLPGIELHCRM